MNLGDGSQGSSMVVELQEQLKTKEEEVKILWNVIKEINKSKGTVNMEQLRNAISQKVNNANLWLINIALRNDTNHKLLIGSSFKIFPNIEK